MGFVGGTKKKTISYRMDFVGGTKKRFPHKRVCWRNQENNFLPNGFCWRNQKKTVSTQMSLLAEPKKKQFPTKWILSVQPKNSFHTNEFAGGTKKKTISYQMDLSVGPKKQFPHKGVCWRMCQSATPMTALSRNGLSPFCWSLSGPSL